MLHKNDISEELYWVRFGFKLQIFEHLAKQEISIEKYAKLLSMRPERVRRILYFSHKTSLRMMVRLARALGLKLAVVAYESDGRALPNDFIAAWERAGKPTEMWEAEAALAPKEGNDESL